MTVQMRRMNDPRMYSPTGDLAHNFAFIVREVARRLQEGVWDEAVQICKEHGVTLPELGKAAEAFCIFVASSLAVPAETMEECLNRSGFTALRGPVQVAFMATLGCVVAGVFWVRVREAACRDHDPLKEVPDLVEAGAECHRVLCLKSPGGKEAR